MVVISTFLGVSHVDMKKSLLIAYILAAIGMVSILPTFFCYYQRYKKIKNDSIKISELKNVSISSRYKKVMSKVDNYFQVLVVIKQEKKDFIFLAKKKEEEKAQEIINNINNNIYKKIEVIYLDDGSEILAIKLGKELIYNRYFEYLSKWNILQVCFISIGFYQIFENKIKVEMIDILAMMVIPVAVYLLLELVKQEVNKVLKSRIEGLEK